MYNSINDYKIMFNKLKSLINGKIEITFGEKGNDTGFFLAETKFLFLGVKYEMNLCVGTDQSFLTNTVGRRMLEGLLYEFYLDSIDNEIERLDKSRRS
jgi:hypothetical protein